MSKIERAWFTICFFPCLILYTIVHTMVAGFVIAKTAYKFNKINHFFDVGTLTLTGGYPSLNCIAGNLDKIQKEFVAKRIKH